MPVQTASVYFIPFTIMLSAPVLHSKKIPKQVRDDKILLMAVGGDEYTGGNCCTDNA